MKSKPAKKTTRKPKNKPPEKSHESVKKSTLDVDSIEKDYRAGQLSNVETGKKHGCGESYIRKLAAIHGWEKDLADVVKKRVREKLVREAVVRKPNAKQPIKPKEIVEAAAEQGAGIVRLHRKDITNLRRLEESLINELQDNPTKLYLAQYQGIIIQKTVSLTVSERAMAANNLANVQHKRIALERQAYNLNDSAGAGGEIEKIQLEFV